MRRPTDPDDALAVGEHLQLPVVTDLRVLRNA
jgi:hypothetical protein